MLSQAMSNSVVRIDVHDVPLQIEAQRNCVSGFNEGALLAIHVNLYWFQNPGAKGTKKNFYINQDILYEQ